MFACLASGIGEPAGAGISDPTTDLHSGHSVSEDATGTTLSAPAARLSAHAPPPDAHATAANADVTANVIVLIAHPRTSPEKPGSTTLVTQASYQSWRQMPPRPGRSTPRFDSYRVKFMQGGT